MENSHKYLVIFNLSDSNNEATFYETLRSIDPHPFTVIDNVTYAIKSKLGISEIFARLSSVLQIEDTLVIVPLKDKYEVQSPEFIHWIKFGN